LNKSYTPPASSKGKRKKLTEELKDQVNTVINKKNPKSGAIKSRRRNRSMTINAEYENE